MPQDYSQTLANNLKEWDRQLKEQQALHRLWLNQDFQQVMVPKLTMNNLWPKPEADIQEFQREYFLSYGACTFANKILAELEGSEQRMRDIQKRIDQEKAKYETTTTKRSR